MSVMNARDGRRGWEFITTYTGGTNQEPVELPFEAQGYSIQLDPTGGSARVEASNNGTGWIPWTEGDISNSSASFLVPMRYIRVVHNTATSSKLSIWGR